MLNFMRFAFMNLTIILANFSVACQPVNSGIDVQKVLNSKSATEDYSAPSKLLKIIQKNPKNEKAWKALHHYRSLTDAGITLTFYRECFYALKENPQLFLDRYMRGDEQALFRMVDALSYDFSGFPGNTFEDTNQVFEKFLKNHKDFSVRSSNFYSVSNAQYDSWRLRYCEFIRKDSKIVPANCK
jgi:hypothetical protein